jgi:hypothetical protein
MHRVLKPNFGMQCTKLHKLLACLTIDRINVFPNMDIICNEEGVLQLKGALTQQCQP